MPFPYFFGSGSRDQVLPSIFFDQALGEVFKLRNGLRVTALAYESARTFLVADHETGASMRRAWTRTAASAAGVIPRTLPAAEMLAGWAAHSRSIISFESPGMET